MILFLSRNLGRLHKESYKLRYSTALVQVDNDTRVTREQFVLTIERVTRAVRVRSECRASSSTSTRTRARERS